MKTQLGGRSSERRKKAAPNRKLEVVLAALRQPLGAVDPRRIVLTFGTVVLLSALLLFPYPHIQRLLHRFNVLGVTLLVALLTCFVTLYIARFEAALYASLARMLLLSILVAVSVLGLKIGGILLNVHQADPQFGYIGLAFITACSMSIALLLDARVAVLISAILSIFSGIVLGNDAGFSIMTFASCLVAILSVSELRSRGDLVRAALAIGLTSVAMAILLGEMRGDSWARTGFSVLWAVAAAPLAVALFAMWVLLFERPFGLATHIGLLELSDPNRPLLKRFMAEAPGTYAHSVMVANLAAAAAEAVGADALLARVAAVYHDLGKMRRAEFFVENQSGDNIHERLNPSLSALVVTAHVKEGLEMADEERLPPVIKDIIVQHHGTSLIRYFYHQATAEGESGRGAALEQQFRYGGPKPQSKEAAIMMLADAVEAASHTLDRPNPARVEELVQVIVEDKVVDGQLDESPITLRDLKVIKDTFVRHLCGMLHSRIEYPNGHNNGKGHTEDQVGGVAKPAVNGQSEQVSRAGQVSHDPNLIGNKGGMINDDPADAGDGAGRRERRRSRAEHASSRSKNARASEAGAENGGSVS